MFGRTKVLPLPLRRFENDQRVVIIARNFPLAGRTGRVVRLRRGDCAAWVEMDEPIPPHCRVFPDGDDRADHVLVEPGMCAMEGTTRG